MDGLIPHGQTKTEHMPPLAPLPMPIQDLNRRPPMVRRQVADRSAWPWRLMCLGGAGSIALALMAGLWTWMRADGTTALEWVILFLVGAVFYWIGLAAATALAGTIGPRKPVEPQAGANSVSVALLLPIYNEDPDAVAARALAMLHDLDETASQHNYALYVLSDTRGDAWDETAAMDRLRALAPMRTPVFYRRRVENTDRKVGNLSDWVRRWGGAHEAFVVLDADSLMSAQTIVTLSDDMASDPDAGLIQTGPQIIGARSLFARAQGFASAIYGPTLGRGLALWSGNSGNFWGHNAIIRTSAFADSAGLPKLRGRGRREQLIWSHDFVEAALLRRRGWSVRLRADLGESFEETPPTLIDHILRDRRWCQGNLQHLRLLGTGGLHPLSRFHLFHGAMGYLLSLGWVLLLVTWSVLGTIDQPTGPWVYFTEAQPDRPNWPMVSPVDSWIFLALMYGLLLVPKLLSLSVAMCTPQLRRRFGGASKMLRSAVQELALSVVYAPCLMVQQCLTVARLAVGKQVGWVPQNRGGDGYTWRETLAFHWMETVGGIALLIAMAMGYVSLWMVPVALSLAVTVPLSKLSSRSMPRLWLQTPQDEVGSGIQARVRSAQDDLEKLESSPALSVAAE
ncbi:MAG: glucans biosynthesis glucosyltransferase MdoH [Pseudomonadota bacterium]